MDPWYLPYGPFHRSVCILKGSVWCRCIFTDNLSSQVDYLETRHTLSKAKQELSLQKMKHAPTSVYQSYEIITAQPSMPQ